LDFTRCGGFVACQFELAATPAATPTFTGKERHEERMVDG